MGSAGWGGIWRRRKPKTGLLGSSRGSGAAPRPTRPPQRLPAAAGATTGAPALEGGGPEKGGGRGGSKRVGRTRWAGRGSRREGREIEEERGQEGGLLDGRD